MTGLVVVTGLVLTFVILISLPFIGRKVNVTNENIRCIENVS